MKLYRFCSHDELRKLLRQETIRNTTDHFNGGRGGSISRGFCLTEDMPAEAWRYLKGNVTPDVCVCLEIPRELLTASRGKYAGKPATTPECQTVIGSTIKREWCISVLKPEWLREIIPLETFVPGYELIAARHFHRNKKQYLDLMKQK